jgi:S-adenosylmethionine hydrolase
MGGMGKYACPCLPARQQTRASVLAHATHARPLRPSLRPFYAEAMPESAPPPVATFTTDFGSADFYVAAMKGALLRHCPRATIVDVSHAVPRHDVLRGAILLERAVDAFPPGTVHVAVVDPGVGTSRRLLIAQWPGQTVVCPDNGLITWTWRRRGPATSVHELTWRPAVHSHVFHGRDILAPAAGKLASGASIGQLVRPMADPVLLPVAPAESLSAGGTVIYVDHFGNATTTIGAELLAGVEVADVRVRGRSVGPPRRTYGDVAVGQPLALVGSSGLLEIAVREGSAAAVLGLCVGDAVRVGFEHAVEPEARSP